MTVQLLRRDAVRLGLGATGRDEAVQLAGETLVAIGAVDPGYVAAMHEREGSLSSYVGEGFALPHGTDAARALVHRPAIAFLQFPGGIDWGGSPVQACIAIAAKENEHVDVMSGLARILLDPAQAEALRTADDPDLVLALLSADNQEADR